MKKRDIFNRPLGILFLLLVVSVSCVPVNKLAYFNDIDVLEEPVVNPKIQKTIMPFDRLYVRVLSIDPQTNQIFGTSEEIRYGDSGSSLEIGRAHV